MRGLLHEVDYRNFPANALPLIREAANQVLGLDDGKKRFADAALAASQAFARCCTLDAALLYRDELEFL